MEVIAGRIKRLKVRVPWNALSSQPVQIEVSGLQVLVSMLPKTDWEQFIEARNKFEVIKGKLLDHAMAVLTDLRMNKSTEQEKTYLMNLTSRIIDNIELTISNIHFRFEELSLPQPLSLGLTMERLEISTTDEQWQP